MKRIRHKWQLGESKLKLIFVYLKTWLIYYLGAIWFFFVFYKVEVPQSFIQSLWVKIR